MIDDLDTVDEIKNVLKSMEVMGYCEGVWFKNNFASVSACNYYAGVATTSNAVSFRSL